MAPTPIRSRERTAIIQSLSAGVVPSIGLQHVQVGRNEEVRAVINDLKSVADGNSTVRFVIGRFGSGKTFFLNLIRTVALKQKFVVLNADVTTDRRLHGSGGQARALYSELMKNLATRSKPEGGALGNLVERWVGDVEYSILESDGTEDDVKAEIERRLSPLRELVGGFDFATVIVKYYEGHLEHNDLLQQSAVRWLRAEYKTKTDARKDLGVRTIIDDSAIYDHLKLMAAFVRIAGYGGMLVNIDELVVLSHRLSNTTARNNNYEAVLRILNDCLQGATQGLSFLFAGTDECLEDRRRGLFSYEALATRLALNRFSSDEHRDLSSPIIRLDNLTPEDCFVLLRNIRRVFEADDSQVQLIPDDGILAFLKECNERMGAAYYQTPRDTVRDFCGLLNVLAQNSAADWRTLLGTNAAIPSASKPRKAVDDLTEFSL